MDQEKAQEDAEVAIQEIRDFARKRLRKRYQYLPQLDLDDFLEKISSISGDLINLFPKIEASKARSSFFSLSAELRNRIYEAVLLKDDLGAELQSEENVVLLGKVRPSLFFKGRIPGLLRASREIRNEAMSIYLSNTFMVIYELDLDRFEMGDEFYGMSEARSIHIPPVKKIVDDWFGLIGRENAARVGGLLLSPWNGFRKGDAMFAPEEMALKVSKPGYTKEDVYNALQLESLGLSMNQFKLQVWGELPQRRRFLSGRSSRLCELLEDGSLRKLQVKS